MGARIGNPAPPSPIRCYVYDIDPADQSRWVRLRDNGTETAVGDFDTADTLLGKLGHRPKAYQENRRRRFLLDGARLEIDSWPRIPPYLEIKAADRAEVVRVAALLGYSENDLTGENTTKVYARYGIDLAEISELRFNED
ncbi:MAG: hypothetical protein M0026_09155 [Nocardiopsaceae bacterium]|nr:hypothetical protein [Nocardiopsaceae bacterium]